MTFFIKNEWIQINLYPYFLIGGVGRRKTFTLMVIIQGFLQYYFKQKKNLDPSKQTIKKMAYTWKVAYNISGSTLHSGLLIPLNKSINDFKPLIDERCDDLAKQNTMFWITTCHVTTRYTINWNP